MYYLPIFLQKSRLKEALEAFKGISLRLLCGSFEEHSKIIPLVFQIERAEELCSNIRELNKNFNCHLGIILSDSELISSINGIDNFVLFAPAASRSFAQENIFQIVLTEWERDAIEKNLDDWGILQQDILVVTHFSSSSPALDPYKKWNLVTVKMDKITKTTLTKLKNYENYIIIGATKQWAIITKLRTAIGDDIRNKQIVTTSYFEDWRIPAHRRKNLAEGVTYTYPTISDKGKKVIESFQKEFHYKPLIYQLLAYSAADIAIESLLKAGPVYFAIRKFLIHNEFEKVISAKIGFGGHEIPAGIPYTIGKSPQDIFQIKYVNKDGGYSPLNKEE